MPDETEKTIGIGRGQHDCAEVLPGGNGVEASRIVEEREVVGVLLCGVEHEARVDVGPQGGNREAEVSTVLVGGEHRPRRVHSGQPTRRLDGKMEWGRAARGGLAFLHKTGKHQLAAEERHQHRGPAVPAQPGREGDRHKRRGHPVEEGQIPVG